MAHPNAPPDLLEVLSRWHPEAILQNPALPLVLLEDPGWASKLQSEAALSMLRCEDVPEMLLHALASRPGSVGQAARLHVGIAGEAGPRWRDEVREALWEATGLPGREEDFPVRLLSLDLVAEWLAEPLAAHGNARVRRAAARSHRTPRDILKLLRRAGSTSDLGGLAPPDPTLTREALDRLARGGPWAKRLAARHPNTLPAALEKLAQTEDITLRRHLVQNPAVPSVLRASLAISLGPEFRRASARDPLTPPDALAVLAADAVRDVRWMAARNPGTPQESLSVLARDADARVRQGAGRNAAASADLLTVLARDPARWVRLAAARHPNTPSAVLLELAEDEDEEVGQTITRRHRIATQDKQFTEHPVVSPSISPTVPKAIPDGVPNGISGGRPVQSQASSSITSSGVISSFVASSYIRTAFMPAPAMPSSYNLESHIGEAAQALDEASVNGGWLGKAAVLACPDVSPKYIASAEDSRLWPCRLAIARNPAAFLFGLEHPEYYDVLRRLARDGNRLVRAAARDALQKVERHEAG